MKREPNIRPIYESFRTGIIYFCLFFPVTERYVKLRNKYRRTSTLTTHDLIICVSLLCSADTAFATHLNTQTSSWRRNINVRHSGMLRTEKKLVWDGKDDVI